MSGVMVRALPRGVYNIDLRDGKAASVAVRIHSGPVRLRTSTDAEGHFEIPDLPPGTWTVEAWGGGYRGFGSGGPGQTITIRLAPD